MMHVLFRISTQRVTDTRSTLFMLPTANVSGSDKEKLKIEMQSILGDAPELSKVAPLSRKKISIQAIKDEAKEFHTTHPYVFVALGIVMAGILIGGLVAYTVGHAHGAAVGAAHQAALMKNEMEDITRAELDGTLSVDTVETKLQLDLANEQKADNAERNAENLKAEAEQALQEARQKEKHSRTAEEKRNAQAEEKNANAALKERDQKLDVSKQLQKASREAFDSRHTLEVAMREWQSFKLQNKPGKANKANNKVAKARLEARAADAKVLEIDIKKVDNDLQNAHKDVTIFSTCAVEAQHAVSVSNFDLITTTEKRAKLSQLPTGKAQEAKLNFTLSVLESLIPVQKEAASAATALSQLSTQLVKELSLLRTTEAKADTDLKNIASAQKRKEEKQSIAAERNRVVVIRSKLFNARAGLEKVILHAMEADAQLAEERREMSQESLKQLKAALSQANGAQKAPAQKLVNAEALSLTALSKLVDVTNQASKALKNKIEATKDPNGPQLKKAKPQEKKAARKAQADAQKIVKQTKQAANKEFNSWKRDKTLNVKPLWSPITLRIGCH